MLWVDDGDRTPGIQNAGQLAQSESCGALIGDLIEQIVTVFSFVVAQHCA
jgi:hypothetical protein